jgi:hypothetical protein
MHTAGIRTFLRLIALLGLASPVWFARHALVDEVGMTGGAILGAVASISIGIVGVDFGRRIWTNDRNSSHINIDWPRLWELLGFALPKKTREKVYEPGHNELLEDFIRAKAYRTKWARRWLALCFTFRTILLVTDCWRVMMADKALSLLMKAVPQTIKRWWLG